MRSVKEGEDGRKGEKLPSNTFPNISQGLNGKKEGGLGQNLPLMSVNASLGAASAAWPSWALM